MKILIVDDHVLIRKGIRMFLEDIPYIKEVYEVDNGKEAVTIAIQNEPDIVLMDLSLSGGLDGFTASKNILSSTDNTKIIVLTMHDEEIYIKKAIAHGISGYLLKNNETNEIERAIQSVMNGNYYYKSSLPKEQLERLMKEKENNSILTPREQEVIRLISLGYTNVQIGEQLHISPRTVERHKENMMTKLSIKETHKLVQYALKNKYVDPL